MTKIKNSWWGTLLTHSLAFTLLIFAIPPIPLIVLNSRSLLIALLVFGFFFGPLYLARFHNGSYRIVGVMQSLAIGLFFATWPQEQLGNLKLQIADHMIGWILLAFIGCGIGQAIFIPSRNLKLQNF